jgi:4-amino-4-deoxy-L-arabinose transferase-like glycosyltransferase
LRFKNSLHVAKAGYPFWQSIVWLFNPFAYYQVQSQAGFLVQLDPLIFILAVLGLPRTFKRSPVFFYWFFVGLIFLFIWSTKWPQYSLVIMAPFCVAAAYGVTSLFDLVKQKLFHREAVNR